MRKKPKNKRRRRSIHIGDITREIARAKAASRVRGPFMVTCTACGERYWPTPIALHGNEGREWKFDKYRGQALITVREYLVGNKLYQAICVMPKRRACNRHIQEFLDSFDLKEQ